MQRQGSCSNPECCIPARSGERLPGTSFWADLVQRVVELGRFLDDGQLGLELADAPSGRRQLAALATRLSPAAATLCLLVQSHFDCAGRKDAVAQSTKLDDSAKPCHHANCYQRRSDLPQGSLVVLSPISRCAEINPPFTSAGATPMAQYTVG